MKVVETDNFGGDYPNEKFLNIPNVTADAAERICAALNEAVSPDHPRYWKSVPDEYVLQPGFEP